MYASIRFIKTSLISAILGLSTYSLNAQATLTSYTANGVDLVYSSVSDVTWTKDANLLGSLFASQGYNTVVNNILAVSPTITNTPNSFSPNGTYTLNSNDFNSNGNATWFGAMAFINYLNNINYAGSNQWRLPTVTDTGLPGGQDGINGTDEGLNTYTNAALNGNELTELYYQELGSKAVFDANGHYQSDYGIKDSGSTFKNVQSYNYWTGTEYATDMDNAWSFATYVGAQQNNNYKTGQFYVWAVNEQISAVPAPAAAWLFATGLPIIAVAKRSRRKCA